MDNSVKSVNQNNTAGQDGQFQQSTSTQSSSAPIGSAHKEMGPVGTGMPEVKPSGSEISPELAKELREIGIKEIQERPNLPDDHKQIGINHAGDSVPARFWSLYIFLS
jgi:hypothetical protein